MKKIISYAACLFIVTAVAAAPGSKLIESFNQTFPNAKNVKWSDDKAGYFVSFNQNENFEKVLYNKQGEFVCSWKYSNGKELPTLIAMALNKNYSDSKVFGVTELTTPDKVVYDIKLNNGSKWYCVTALADGTITKEKEFNQNITSAH